MTKFKSGCSHLRFSFPVLASADDPAGSFIILRGFWISISVDGVTAMIRKTLYHLQYPLERLISHSPHCYFELPVYAEGLTAGS